MVSLYSPPDERLFQLTHGTLIVCEYQSEQALIVINVKSILSVVAMIPFPFIAGGNENQYFTIEKIGLDVIDTEDPEDEG